MKQVNLNQVKVGQEINIPTAFVVTLSGKKNQERKFKSNKSYWVNEVTNSGIVVDYYSYNGRVKAGVTTELIRFDKNKNLQVNLIS